MKQQKQILAKILVIIGVFVITYLPMTVMFIVLAMDYGNRKSYMTAFFCTALLGMSNSILSPCVYVWRYPECRYKLMNYCTFWKTERQQTLEARLNQYNTTFYWQETSGISASTSTSGLATASTSGLATASTSGLSAAPPKLSQAIGTMSATIGDVQIS